MVYAHVIQSESDSIGVLPGNRLWSASKVSRVECDLFAMDSACKTILPWMPSLREHGLALFFGLLLLLPSLLTTSQTPCISILTSIRAFLQSRYGTLETAQERLNH